MKRFCKKEILIFAVVFLLQVLFIFVRSTPLITDELNPLAFGFKMRGEDWRNYLTADGYYYKYGQLLFQLPVILLIREPVTLFRSLLIINSLVVSVIPVCAYRILKKYLKCSNEFCNIGISFLTGILPAATLDSKLIWSEPFLLTLSWIILLLLVKSLEKGERKYTGYCNSIMLAILQSYAYMVHNRGIIILIATVCCALFIHLILKEKNLKFIPYIFITFIFLCIDAKISESLQSILYLSRDGLIGERSSFISRSFFRTLFSIKGLQTIVQEIMGWLFASFSSTFGLAALGLTTSCFLILDVRKWKEQEKQEILISLFALLCFCGSLALGTVFFFDGLYSSGYEIARRGDKLIYVRYLDAANIILSFLGLYFLFIRKKYNRWKYLYFSVAIYIVVYGFYLSVISERINNSVTWPHITMLINYFCKTSESMRGGMYSKVEFFAGGIAVFGLCSFGLYNLLLFFRRKKIMVMSIYASVFLVGYIWNSYNILYREDSYMRDLAYAYSDIFKSVSEEEGLKNIFLADGIIRCGFQYVYSDYYIIVPEDSYGLQEENMFILAEENDIETLGFTDTLYEIISVEPVKEFHLYIRGEEMKEYMQKRGYETRNTYKKS